MNNVINNSQIIIQNETIRQIVYYPRTSLVKEIIVRCVKSGLGNSIEDNPSHIKYNMKGEVMYRAWYKQGIPHRDGGLHTKEIYNYDGTYEYHWINEKNQFHRSNYEPAIIEYFTDGSIKSVKYYENGEYTKLPYDFAPYVIYSNNMGYYKYEEHWPYNPNDNCHPLSFRYNHIGLVIRVTYHYNNLLEYPTVRTWDYTGMYILEEEWKTLSNVYHRDSGPARKIYSNNNIVFDVYYNKGKFIKMVNYYPDLMKPVSSHFSSSDEKEENEK